LGPSVPKQAAARALGVSLTALDHWIDRGLVPVVRTKESSRLRPETRPLLELLAEIERLRERGRSGRLVAAALRSLGRRPFRAGRWIVSSELARLPRPNVPAWELQANAASTTPLERLESVAELSEAVTGITQLRAAE
jgi:DNA-binding transcriptional MerR regulator